MNAISFPHPVASDLILSSGDRLSQPEFHRRYQQYPSSCRFELVEGTVFIASPLGKEHGAYEPLIATLLTLYAIETPGVRVFQNTTVLLDTENEVQPDACLLLPAMGPGSAAAESRYITTPPPLVVEIAHSSVAIDLHAKRFACQKAGVQEYIVLCVEDRVLRWFPFAEENERPLPSDGVLRSGPFPGLWIDSQALLNKNAIDMLARMQDGLASPEHAQFVQRLTSARTPEAPR